MSETRDSNNANHRARPTRRRRHGSAEQGGRPCRAARRHGRTQGRRMPRASDIGVRSQAIERVEKKKPAGRRLAGKGDLNAAASFDAASHAVDAGRRPVNRVARRARQAIARAALIRSARASRVSCCAGDTASPSSRASFPVDPRLSSQRGASSGEKVGMMVCRLMFVACQTQSRFRAIDLAHSEISAVPRARSYDIVNGYAQRPPGPSQPENHESVAASRQPMCHFC